MSSSPTSVAEINERLPFKTLLRPIQKFIRTESSSGILLLMFTAFALLWANSPWAANYHRLWETRMTVGIGGFEISKPLLLWINDGLMAIFFFVVGLEIKREVLIGELSTFRQAALPIAAAVGGMVVPALLFTVFNAGTPGGRGWGIPMATDIAFALGVLALLGSRAPLALKVFLTAFAIVDDIGAVLVIAFFYTETIYWSSLVAAAVFLLLLIAVNAWGIRNALVYLLLGTGLWIAFLKSGVHATVAGVLLAMTIPASRRINVEEFIAKTRGVLDDFDRNNMDRQDPVDSTEFSDTTLHTIEETCEALQSPLHRIEHSLHPWVSYAIMPVFALANAGVTLGGAGVRVDHSVPLGIIIGLVIGKPLGITLCAWLAVRFGLADKPASISWRQLHGAGWLGGIGFTMALFIASLGFAGTDFLEMSKIGILVASLIAGVVGFFLLRNAGTPEIAPENQAPT